jgi:hypothetical protein
MAISIFRRPYTIRRHGEQVIVNGYAARDYSDITLKLHVTPLSSNDVLALPEGERTVSRVKSYGADALITADEYTGTPGDWLLYDGKWYECKSCDHWLHTPLTHYECSFVIIADQSGITPPEEEGDPDDGQ